MSTDRKPGRPKGAGDKDRLTFDEIAARLDMPSSTVKTIADRALKKMRAAAEADGYSFDALFEDR